MDRERVIHAVETAFELWIDEYTGCSWFKEDEVRQAKEDALALLKEREWVVRCKDCKQSGIDSTSYPHYWCSAHAEYHDGAWFCADGEMKE